VGNLSHDSGNTATTLPREGPPETMSCQPTASAAAVTGRPRRLILAALAALAFAGALVAYRTTGYQPGIEGGDAWNYLAAGERLNAGHPLYALEPGDRPVVLVPPYWTVPLLAPPPIAVIWRPLAAAGPGSMDAWGALNLVATLATVAYLAIRGFRAGRSGLVPLAWLAALALPVGLLALSANVNGLVLAATVLAWRYRDRPALAGVSIAFAIAMKLTPLLFVIWLVAAGRHRAVVVTAAFGLLFLAVSVAGAGTQAHLDWLRLTPGAQPSPLSLSGLSGLPSIVVAGLSAVIVALAALLAGERWAFTTAAVLASLATPAFYFQAAGLLAAAAAPWVEGSEVVRPVDAQRHDEDPEGEQEQPARADAASLQAD
jgi:alpha-1,2-mannosyltransferase